MNKNYNLLCFDGNLSAQREDKIDRPSIQTSGKTRMSWLVSLFLFAAVFLSGFSGTAQNVIVNPGAGSYATLKGAFDAINAGTHTGAITVDIVSGTTETAPAVLNSSGAGSASYTSVYIAPSNDNVVITSPTATGRGVIELNGADNVTIDGDNPNTIGTNRNLTITNSAAATITYTSVIRLATTSSTIVANCDNVAIKNVIVNGNATARIASTSTTGSENTTFGVLVAHKGGTALNTDPPTAITSVTPSMASGTTTNNLQITNCAINACARGIGYIGINAANCNSLTVSNNVIGSSTAPSPAIPPYTAPTTTVYTKGILVAGVTSLSITGNTIQNIITAVGTTTSGIELNAAIGTTGGTIDVSGNIVSGVHNYNSSQANGILFSSATLPYTANNNTITNIATTASSSALGMNMSSSGASGIVANNKISAIYARSTSGYAATGINLTAGSNITVSNNMIWDLNIVNNNNAYTFTFGAKGIRIASGTGHKIYHNTVNMYGTMLGASSTADNTACLSISSTSSTGIDIRNNVFSNTITSNTVVNNACVQLPSGGTSAMNLTLNNNAYYTGAAVNSYVLNVSTGSSVANSYTAANFSASATTPATNSRSYTSPLSATGLNDNASFASTSAAPFVSSTDLHINPAIASGIESGGAALAAVTTDIDGQARNASNPDMGADEGTFTLLDLTGPSITYTALVNTVSTANRVFNNVIITDISGVNVAPGTTPRLYYKLSSDTNNLSGWKHVDANGTTSPFDFTIDYSLLSAGSVTAGNVIQYFVVAQDTAVPTVSINSGTFAASASSVALTAAQFPIGGTINSYVISSLLSGTKTVCPSGCDYATLTVAGGAFEAINNNVVNGNMTLEISADLTTETGAVSLNEFASPFTLIIKPTGGARIISGTSTAALITLNGADNVTIDGSLSSTANTVCPPGAATRDLTITNNNTATTSAVVWIQTTAGLNSASGNTVKNCNISGNATTTTVVALGSGGATIGTGGANNNNNHFINNNLIKAQYGIYSGGASTANKNTGTVIQQNTINGTVVSSSNIRNIGIFVAGEDGILISGNTIANMVGANDGIAISCGANGFVSTSYAAAAEVVNATITNNIIDNIRGASTYSAAGIFIGTSANGGTNLIANNSISNITANASLGDFGAGILVGGGPVTTNIYHNTVSLSGTLSGGSYPQYALALGGTDPVYNVKNNIFLNSAVNGAGSGAGLGSYAIGIGYGTFVNLNSDNNDFYTSGTEAKFAKTTTLATGGTDLANLAAYQAATGKDAASKNSNPVFTSTTNLRPVDTDAANIGLYNAGTNLTAAVPSDIDCGTRSTTPSLGFKEFTPPTCSGATGGTAIAGTEAVCVSGTSVISATGFSGGIGATFQWQTATDLAFTTPVDIGSPASSYSAYTTPTISSTSYYRLKVECAGAAAVDYSTVATVTVNNPSIVSTTPNSICGTGTVSLQATANPGETVKWYAAATGGLPLFTGTNFTTPSISTTTNYYAEASVSGAVTATGKPAPLAGDTGSTLTNWGIVFDVTKSVVLQSVDVYSTAAGTVNIAIMNAAMTTELFSTGNIAITNGGATTPNVVPINFSLPAGTGYRIVVKAFSGVSLVRSSTSAAFPYNSDAINVTASEWGGTTTGTYYYFYNFKYLSSCINTSRSLVVATVNSAPTIVKSSDTAICNGQSTPLSVSSSNDPNYTYTWAPATGLSGTTGANVLASPTQTTVYTVTANDAGSGCHTSATVTVTVNQLPTAVVIAPANSAICSGAITTLSATGGMENKTVTSGTGANTSTAQSTTAALGPNPLQNYYGGVKQQWIYTASELAALGMQTGSSINSIAVNLATANSSYTLLNVIVKMKNTATTSYSGLSAWESGMTTVRPAASLVPAVGLNTIALTSPFTWDGVSSLAVEINFTNVNAPTTGTNAAKHSPTSFVSTLLYKVDNASSTTVNAYAGAASHSYSARTDVTFDFTSPAAVTWTPITGLYSDAGASTPYVLNTPATTVYAKPSSTAVYAATATSGAGCPTSGTATITIGSTTWNGTAWSNSAPTAVTAAEFTGDYTSSGDLSACSLTVTSGNVTVNPGHDFTIKNAVVVNGGSLTFENNSNLIQTSNAANTGAIKVKREATMRRLDYVYWGSPVTGQNLKTFSPQTVSPPVGASRFYTMDETTNSFSVIVDPTIVNFDLAKGYMLRAPNNFPTNGTQATFFGEYNGVPNNGNAAIAITNTAVTGQGFNMLGNPYPSTVNANLFLAQNPGALYFWAHVNQNAASGANYATYTTFGTAAATGGATPDGSIAVGQGFLLKTATVSGTATFMNSMRTGNNSANFFRNANVEKNRIWLNLSNEVGMQNQILVGYMEGATMDADVSIDAKQIESGISNIASLIGDQKYNIQARALPFVDTDEVPLSFNALASGTFTISIDHVDGLFAESQDVFIKDNVTGITHNVKESGYTFAAETGTVANRFSVVFQNSTLGIENPAFDANNVVVFKNNNVLNINSGSVTMSGVKVFDIRGRLIFEQSDINANTAVLTNLRAEQEVLLVQITSDDNKVVTKKVVY